MVHPLSMGTHEAHEKSIVVGWCGSSASTRAVEVAAQFAERHGCAVEVVLAWDYLNNPRHQPPRHASVEDVSRLLDEVVATAQEHHPSVTVRGTAQVGLPVVVIPPKTTQALMLVVGRSEQDLGLFGTWTPDEILRQVHCPVVFVP